MKNNKVILILVFGLLLGFISVGDSGAITSLMADRQTNGASTVPDSDAILQLNGFDSSYVLTSSYLNTGTIVNNSNKTLQLRLYIDPNITHAIRTPTGKSLPWTLSYRLYRNDSQFSSTNFTGNGIKDVKGVWTPRFQISPGDTFTLQTRMITTWAGTYLFAAYTSFQFSGISAEEFSVIISDSPSSPRLHTYTSSET